MARRYRESFQFFDTEDQAKEFCDKENLNRYIKEHHPASYTPWTSKDGKEKAFVAWYSTN
jgi:hypothetical protein